jgi:hypothetical protein
MLKSSCYCSERSAFKIIITSVSYRLILILLYKLWYQIKFSNQLNKLISPNLHSIYWKSLHRYLKLKLIKILISKLMQKNLFLVV